MNRQKMVGTGLVGIIAVCVIVFILLSSQNIGFDYQAYDWNRSSPEEAGFNSSLLETNVSLFRDVFEYQGALSLVIVKNHSIIYSKYFDKYDSEYQFRMHSATKSVTSLLFGIALDMGYFESVHQKMIDFFPELSLDNANDSINDIEIVDMLTMKTGFDYTEDPYDNTIFSVDNWEQYLFDQSMSSKPGEVFNYNSLVTHTLGVIIEKQVGMPLDDFAQRVLFNPLGINENEVKWEKQVDIGAAGYLFMTTEDMAKIGQLMLNNGSWNNKQIVSPEWIRNSTLEHTENAYLDYGYGYQWWINDESYSAIGFKGQIICIVPQEDLVIAMTNNFLYLNDYTQVIESFLNDYFLTTKIL